MQNRGLCKTIREQSFSRPQRGRRPPQLSPTLLLTNVMFLSWHCWTRKNSCTFKQVPQKDWQRGNVGSKDTGGKQVLKRSRAK